MKALPSLILAVLWLLPAIALAESACPEARTPQEERSFARNAFAEGERLFTAGDFAAAIERFQCSYRLVPHPNTFFNMAEATEEGGDPRRALALYQEYRTLYHDTGDLEEVEARIARLGPIVAALPPEPPPEPEAPPDLSATGREDGVGTEERSPDVPVPPPQADQDGSRRARQRRLRLAGWVTFGLGLAAGGAGAGLLVAGQSTYDDFETEQRQPSPDQMRLQSLSDRGSALDAAGYALVAVGGAALVTSIALLVVGHRSPRRAEQARVEFTPLATRSIIGLALSGRF